MGDVAIDSDSDEEADESMASSSEDEAQGTQDAGRQAFHEWEMGGVEPTIAEGWTRAEGHGGPLRLSRRQAREAPALAWRQLAAKVLQTTQRQVESRVCSG